jgi:putative flippase GtrA
MWGIELWQRFLAEKNHRGVQFLKYCISGGLATVVDMTVFFLLA